MTTVMLIGITKKGKEKIKLHGDQYNFIKEDSVEFAKGKHILLESLKDGSRRWIKAKGDENFEML